MSQVRKPVSVMVLIPLIYLVFISSEFLSLTQLALTLTARGESALAVGWVMSAFWVGILSSSLCSHRVVVTLGYSRTFIAGSVAATLAVLSMALHSEYAGWLVGSFVLGCSGGLVWVSGESWLAEAAPPERRGFYVGLFETTVGVGMIIGPMLLPLSNWLGMPPLVMATLWMTGTVLISLQLLHHTEPAVHTDEEDAAGPIDWRAVAMPLAGVAILSGMFEGGSATMLPSISMRTGFEASAAALLGSVIGAGSALMQTPFGMAADRLGLRRTMLAAWGMLVVAVLGMWAFGEGFADVLWPVGFVLGGAGGAVYTLVVVELGHRLSGGGLVRAMSLLVTSYTLGTSAGPVAGGWLFDVAGLHGLAAGLVAVAVVGALVAAGVFPRQRSVALAGSSS